MRRASAAVFAANVLLVATQVGVLVSGVSDPVAGDEPGEPTPTPIVSPSFSLSPEPSPSEMAEPASVVDGLGAWVDRYDVVSEDPDATLSVAAENGATTLYLNTSTTDQPDDLVPGLGPWLAAADRRGLGKVGWYVPTLRDVDRDLRRLRAAARFEAGGTGFDAIALDLVSHDLDSATYNARLRDLLDDLDLGKPVVVVTMSERILRAAGPLWEGLPWDRLSALADAWIVYEPWAAPDCDATCAGERAAAALRAIRRRIGEEIAVHLLGGPGDDVSSAEVGRFVSEARAGGAAGVSIYDAATTRPAHWRALGSF